MLLKNFFLLQLLSKRQVCVYVCEKDCFWDGLCLRQIGLVKKLIPKFCVISSSRWRGRFAKYWIYLGSLSLNNFFTKQFRFVSFQVIILSTLNHANNTTALKLFGIRRNWKTISRIIMFSMESWDNLLTWYLSIWYTTALFRPAKSTPPWKKYTTTGCDGCDKYQLWQSTVSIWSM